MEGPQDDLVDPNDDILDDIIDENEIFEPLDPLPQLDDEEDETAVKRTTDEAAKDDPPPKKKRRTSGQRVLLNEARLLSDNGIRAVPDFFENIKFKGKGHEASDLKLLLRRYEYWAQSLFPKQRFEDVVQRVENLCQHKAALKRRINDMRMGIAVTDTEEVTRRIDGEGEDGQTSILNDSGDAAKMGDVSFRGSGSP